MQPRPLLIFLHLPKTAGSTLAQIIERQYGSDAVLDLYDSGFGEELTGLSRSQMAGLRTVMGHFYFGVHRFLSRPYTYITVLRDPVERVISHYYYVRRDPTHYLYPLVRKMSLGEYVTSCGLAEPNNDQTRLLAGMVKEVSSGLCSADMLPVAKKNLHDHFAVVGLTEDFDRSLILIKRVLGWRSPYYVKRNVAKRRPRREEIPPETLSLIQAHNELDFELYGYAKELLHEQLRLQGHSFEQELTIFKKLNLIYSTSHLLQRLR